MSVCHLWRRPTIIASLVQCLMFTERNACMTCFSTCLMFMSTGMLMQKELEISEFKSKIAELLAVNPSTSTFSPVSPGENSPRFSASFATVPTDDEVLVNSSLNPHASDYTPKMSQWSAARFERKEIRQMTGPQQMWLIQMLSEFECYGGRLACHPLDGVTAEFFIQFIAWLLLSHYVCL